MPDAVDQMLIDVRARTQGFAEDMAQMRRDLDGELVSGFARAGDVLERGLLTAIRRGSLGFEDLQASATKAIDRIAAQALKLGLGEIFGSNDPIGRVFNSFVGGILGLPGRATGGPVSAQRGYLVGERGPELFVPASAGRVEANAGTDTSRDVKVSIAIAAPRGTTAPVAMQRSARQVASAVRRALGT